LVLEAERSAVRHTALPVKSKSLFRRWRNRVAAESLVTRESPLLIHAHGWDVAALGARIAARKALPLLIDLVHPIAPTPSWRKLLQTAANCGARFRVPSSFMARHLTDDHGLQTAFLRVVPPGVDLQWFDAVRVPSERINSLYKLWRLPEQATVVVMATPLAAGSGHKLFLEALAAMKNSDLYAVLIGGEGGNPAVRATVERAIAELDLEGRVIMPETCADWPAACWLSSLVLAINALPRGLAAELLAAQAIGRPVIVTDCGANAEFVKSGETAWVIGTEDKEALVAALREALAMSAARRIDLALRTREFVGKTFPMEAWRDALFGIYDDMLASPSLREGHRNGGLS